MPDRRSILHPFCRSNGERPNIHDLIQNVFRWWFSQHRKAIRRDELYAPSCQRLTRPASPSLFLSPSYIYASLFTQLAPRRALAKQYRTLLPVFGLEKETWFTAYEPPSISLSSALELFFQGRYRDKLLLFSKVAVLCSASKLCTENKSESIIALN